MCLFPGLAMAADDGELGKYLNKHAFDSVADLLDKGDMAYRGDDMQTAVDQYAAVRKEISGKVMPPLFKQAMDERYAQALAQLAYQKAVVGKRDSAMKLIKEAYEVSPQAPGVKRVKLQLEDPVRFNPAASDKNAENVKKVGELLLKAFGSYDLGDFDEADKLFDSVLSIDATNTAARRGKEKVGQARQNYYNAAHDQTRAKMMNDVEAAWESTVPAETINVQDDSQTATIAPAQRGAAGKLNSLVIDNVNLEDVNLLEALDFIRRQARRVDTSSNEADRGINVLADIGTSNDPAAREILARRFNVKLRNAPLSEVLRYIADMSGTQVRVTPYATKLVRGGDDSGTVMTRSFKVSPDFFSGGSDDSSSGSDDAFGTGEKSSGLKIRHSNPKAFFENSGIKFPEGTSVQYNAGSTTLLVRNTGANLNLIEDMIAAKQAEKPAQVIIKTTFMEVSRKQVHELGFDWVIGDMSIGGQSRRYIGGGSQGSGGDVLQNMPGPVGETPNPTGVVTAGLRSGNEVFKADSLDSVIEAGVNRTKQQEYVRRAPGILSVRAIFANGDISMVMRGLDQDKSVDMLQQPQIIARSGEKASFRHGRDFPYPTDYTEPQLPSSTGGDNNSDNGSYNNSGGSNSQVFPVTPSHPTGFTTKSVGVTLEVEPTISEDRTMVDLALAPEIVAFDGFVNYGNPIMTSMVSSASESGIASVELSKNQILQPVFSRETLSTSVTIASGYTVVLGGLLKSKKEKFEDKVPILGDIPYFGRLFRSEGEQTQEKVLIIMVRAEVVDPSGQQIQSLPAPADPS